MDNLNKFKKLSDNKLQATIGGGMSGYIQGIPDFLKGYLHGISAANKHKKGRLGY